MQKVELECESNKYVASALVSIYSWIVNATADCVEDYTVGDVVFSAITNIGLSRHDLENKRILGGWQLKYDGQWNKYFTTEIYKKLRFETDMSSGLPIYFINETKWNRIMDAKGCLCYLAPDGMLLFSNKALKDAFVGFADYYVKHTTQFADKRMEWEKKAVLNLEYGAYVPLSPPRELFEK